MRRRTGPRQYGPWPFGQRPTDRTSLLPPNPWQVGDRVRFHPIIGEGDDGHEYVVRSIGTMLNQPIAWLEGKKNYVAAASLSRADAPRQLTATDHLAAAREAWRVKRDAEATLSRLRQYRSLNASMKADRDRACERLSEADATLKRVLGGAS